MMMVNLNYDVRAAFQHVFEPFITIYGDDTTVK